jgi:hypothetical protein
MYLRISVKAAFEQQKLVNIQINIGVKMSVQLIMQGRVFVIKTWHEMQNASEVTRNWSKQSKSDVLRRASKQVAAQ